MNPLTGTTPYLSEETSKTGRDLRQFAEQRAILSVMQTARLSDSVSVFHPTLQKKT
jgi:hypothetical protein